MSDKRRIGVYICHCGGNISDYVEVEDVRKAIEKEDGVIVAKTTMFACSDASQEEMIEDIKKEKLNGLVVASCSPKLHLFTFRAAAERAGLNPYQYIQVNLREQCSWAHRENKNEATEKGIHLVKGGIAKARLTKPLSTLRIDTKPSVLIIGGGVAGMRAALSLSDLNLAVYLIEREEGLGGWTGKWERVFPNDRKSSELIENLRGKITERENITAFTNTELIEKSGSIGDFKVKIKVKEKETISLNVGSIIVATGFDTYIPGQGEFGYKEEGVITLPEFKELADKSRGELKYNGKVVENVVYIYCVGSRQHEGDAPNEYCSRYCCSAAVHTAYDAHEKFPRINQYHLYRDVRTYGKYELMFEKASREGSIFIKYEESDPPVIKKSDDGVSVTVKDQLLGGEEIEIIPDLIVLVTGMIPRKNDKLTQILKLPLGKDGFYNEIHPKLRPVETLVNGVFIAGAAQGPKTLAESTASGLAAVSKSAALLMKGYVDLEPLIAKVNPELCVWCGKCAEVCPYDAIDKITCDGKELAHVIPSLCKGGGPCVPVCPKDAIDIEGYTDAQIRAMIDSLGRKVA